MTEISQEDSKNIIEKTNDLTAATMLMAKQQQEVIKNSSKSNQVSDIKFVDISWNNNRKQLEQVKDNVDRV